jgi:hypothetical protein
MTVTLPTSRRTSFCDVPRARCRGRAFVKVYRRSATLLAMAGALSVAQSPAWAAEVAGSKKIDVARRIGEYSLSDEEWQTKLTPPQYSILRQANTERPFVSPLNNEKRRGAFLNSLLYPRYDDVRCCLLLLSMACLPDCRRLQRPPVQGGLKQSGGLQLQAGRPDGCIQNC